MDVSRTVTLTSFHEAGSLSCAALQFSKSISKSPRFSANLSTAGICHELARSGNGKLYKRGCNRCEYHQNKETDYSSASIIFIAPAESSKYRGPLDHGSNHRYYACDSRSHRCMFRVSSCRKSVCHRRVVHIDFRHRKICFRGKSPHNSIKVW